MTVKELVKELKGYVKDWELSEQIEIVDTGLGFDDIHEVLLEFDMEG